MSRERSTNAPGRSWHAGNCGPDYHVESMRKKRHGNLWDRPRAVDTTAASIRMRAMVDEMPLRQSQGRDPHDKVTLELPLWSDPNPLREAAEGCWIEGKDAASWLLLMEWAGMPIGIEESCNASR